MSDNISLPSIEAVKIWSPQEVITFLESKKEELFLYNEDIDIIKKNRVSGRVFLELNVDKLMQIELKMGPAESIARLVKEIKYEGQEISPQELLELRSKFSISSSVTVTKRHFSDLNIYEEEQQNNVKKIQNYPLSSFTLLNNFIEHHIKDKQLLIYHPPKCIGSPVQVYHNVFSQFMRDYRNEDLEMEKEHYQWTQKLINEMVRLYHSESNRSIVFSSVPILNPINPDESYNPDGSYNPNLFILKRIYPK
ncbi:hypothetical protein Glove_48g54 [Diversispora epigaea]|uniref:SAM domain-containing protein n=1 Tax=Diversispora epigaea TaxID=1348612 RepID=A0A397JE78_9GLOM|nr:hypothetical protein Glove_48g54 [Diversispora epigaea]